MQGRQGANRLEELAADGLLGRIGEIHVKASVELLVLIARMINGIGLEMMSSHDVR